ncbi:hypothetical protein RDI58_026774 [Solanum bulbocastanum]|uniref:Uncharacterized protein n=1 Tax=Solanum bulbocastanum TaxID=147425 RepID=A0AAN8SU85_SOLBU
MYPQFEKPTVTVTQNSKE